MACRNIALVDHETHHRIKRAHLGPDGRIADKVPQTTFASLAPPRRIVGQAILPEQVNLCAATLIVQNAAALPIVLRLARRTRLHQRANARIRAE
jgi:hypothetical protein